MLEGTVLYKSTQEEEPMHLLNVNALLPLRIIKSLVLRLFFQSSEGATLNFYVKGVKEDTLSSRAGIQAGDRIVQVRGAL